MHSFGFPDEALCYCGHAAFEHKKAKRCACCDSATFAKKVKGEP